MGPFPLQPLLPDGGFRRMIPFVPSAAAKNRVSRSARSFAASRKTADPRTERRSLLVNLDKQPTVIHRPDGSTINLTYDSAGRLATTTYPAGPAARDGTITVTRSYNPTTGKPASVSTSDGQTVSYGYDGQLLTLTYGKLSYTYTVTGDLQSKTDISNGQVTSYAYDAQGNLRHVDLPDGRAIDYVIDSENRRVAKRINGAVVRRWNYDGQLMPVAEFDGTGTLLTRYLDGVTVKGLTSYRVVADHLGTPRLVVNSTTGAVAERLDFDEWGQIIADSSAGFQVFGFAGGIYDADTGLVRFGARDYDAHTGRWNAKDSIRFAGGDTNLFGYVLSDPVNHVDRTGNIGLSCWAAISLCVARAAYNGIENAPKISELREKIDEIVGRIKALQDTLDDELAGNPHPGCGDPDAQIKRLEEEARKLAEEEAKARVSSALTSHLKDAACGAVVSHIVPPPASHGCS